METCGWSVGQTDRPSSPHSGDATSVSVGFLERKGEGGRERGALIRITGSVMYLAYLSESGSKFSFEVDDTDAKL